MHNQWAMWESQHAEHLAATAEARLGRLLNQDTIATQAKNSANYISANGVEHYQRYKADIALLGEMHMNAFRFGIEWSRVEPQPGEWDKAAIAHYLAYIAELKAAGVTPVLTLWHWTLPVWFANMGGFEKRTNLTYFDRYIQKIADLFGNELTYVITLNEPNVYAGSSYATGEWPPQKKQPLLALRVYYNLMLAHKQAYVILKQTKPSLQVGVAAQLFDTRPTAPRNVVNRAGVAIKLYAWNWWFLERIKHHQDFIGLNYYFTEYQDWLGHIKNPTVPVSDLGWYMEPAGIEDLLVQVSSRYKVPIIITENGLADSTDKHRTWWLKQTLVALEGALKRGVRLHGYLHWSLLDNFEWAYGWWPQFGLVHVDRKTMKRTIRPSARWFAAKIKAYQGG
jgi:beta-glucosidase